MVRLYVWLIDFFLIIIFLCWLDFWSNTVNANLHLEISNPKLSNGDVYIFYIYFVYEKSSNALISAQMAFLMNIFNEP